jgi:hypothetical protein
MTTSHKPTFTTLPPQISHLSPLPPLNKRSVSKGTAHDFWKHYQERPLDAIFRPKSVAVVGASEKEESVGEFFILSGSVPLGTCRVDANDHPEY